MANRFFILLLMITIVLTLTGCCRSFGQSFAGDKPPEIIVGAASDLQYAFPEIGEIFSAQTGAKVTFSFGSSGQLRDQIANGAPFDVFASANTAFVDTLRDMELTIPETQAIYSIGRIVLATKKDAGFPLQSLSDLTSSEIVKVAIANPDHAPYGKAAQEALISAGVWDSIQDKLVFGNNISDTLTLMVTGNADVGIVALSIADPQVVDYTLLDEALHNPLEQALTVVKSTKNEDLARAFAQLVVAEEGKAVLKKYGFVVPE